MIVQKKLWLHLSHIQPSEALVLRNSWRALRNYEMLLIHQGHDMTKAIGTAKRELFKWL